MRWYHWNVSYNLIVDIFKFLTVFENKIVHRISFSFSKNYTPPYNYVMLVNKKDSRWNYLHIFQWKIQHKFHEKLLIRWKLLFVFAQMNKVSPITILTFCLCQKLFFFLYPPPSRIIPMEESAKKRQWNSVLFFIFTLNLILAFALHDT